MVLTRQGLPTLRTEHVADNLCAKGGYVLAEAQGGAEARAVTLIASGSEVSVAMTARDILNEGGIDAAVVSLPCFELFDGQNAAYRQAVLGRAPRIAVEAAVGFGWDKYLGENGRFVGMTGFGASAPAKDLFAHFGITAERVAEEARSLIGA